MEVAVEDNSYGFDDTPWEDPREQPRQTPREQHEGQARPLAEVLTALSGRVAPVSMARERTLPVGEQYADLLAEAGLMRGRVLSCVGAAATSLALGLIAPAVAAGAWVAVIDAPTVGLDAANELGVPLERMVAIDTRSGAAPDDAGRRWAEVVAAAADGFDVLIVRVPDDARAATVRKVATRLQQRGVVMVVLGEPGPLVCDGVLDAVDQTWAGLGNGWGHLRRRSIEVSATGRRIPGRRCQTMVLPDVQSGVEPDVQSGVESGVTVAADAAAPAAGRRQDIAELSNAS